MFDVDGSRLGLVEISVASYLFQMESIGKIHSLIKNFISHPLSISRVILSSSFKVPRICSSRVSYIWSFSLRDIFVLISLKPLYSSKFSIKEVALFISFVTKPLCSCLVFSKTSAITTCWENRRTKQHKYEMKWQFKMKSICHS